MFINEKNKFKAVGKLSIKKNKDGKDFSIHTSKTSENWRAIKIEFTFGDTKIPVYVNEFNKAITPVKLDKEGKAIKLNEKEYDRGRLEYTDKIDPKDYLITDTRELGSITKSQIFYHPYDWAEKVSNNLANITKSNVEIEGNVVYEFYKGYLKKKYKITSIKTTTKVSKPSFLIDETVAYRREDIVDNKIPYYVIYNTTYKQGGDYVLTKGTGHLELNASSYSDGLFANLDIVPEYLKVLQGTAYGLIRVTTQLVKGEVKNDNEVSVDALDPTTRALYKDSSPDIQKKILEGIKNIVTPSKASSDIFDIYMFHINEHKMIFETLVDDEFKVATGSQIEKELEKRRKDKQHKITSKTILGEGNDSFSIEPSFETPIFEPNLSSTPTTPIETVVVIEEPTITPTESTDELDSLLANEVPADDTVDDDWNF